jgi:hypothetical protein
VPQEPPTNAACIAAPHFIEISRENLKPASRRGGCRNTRAVTAPDVPTLRAFTMMTKAGEKIAVNATIAPNFAVWLCKYNTNIVEAGNNEETTAPIAWAVVPIVVSS